MKKECVIYCRVSLKKQEYESQSEDLMRYAEANGYKVVTEPFGEKESGFDEKAERDDYVRMKEYVISNNIKHILIWEVSRLARTTLKSLQEIDFFKKHGVDIYFKKENINTLSDSAQTKLFLTILSSIAEIERDTIVERFSRGRTSSVLKGKRTGYCFLPYGFSANKESYLVINENEANVVREIYNMYVTGTSMRAIAINLNSRNIPTRHTSLGKIRTLQTGKVCKIVWRNNSIITILKNPLYKGERKYTYRVDDKHREEIMVNVPQIVDTVIWDKVQEMIKGNVGYKLRTKYNYLFKGKLFCGHCGYMLGTRTETRYKHKPSVYYCNGRFDITFKCKAGQFDSKVFDEYIYNQLFKNIFFHISMYEENAKAFDVKEKLNQIEFLKTEIQNQEARKKRINNLYKDGHIGESEFKQDHAAIRKIQIELTNNIIKIEKEIENHQDWDLQSVLASLTNETNFDIKHEFIKKYVDRITFYKVDNNKIDFSNLTYSDYWKDGEKQLKNPNGRDKLIYVEILAFGNSDPVKVVLSNASKICYTSKNLQFSQERNELTIITEFD
jgi:site-specific DNA recombinase